MSGKSGTKHNYLRYETKIYS